MLVITRKIGERVYIGNEVCITMVDTERGKCKIGIEAPGDVLIAREEILSIEKRESIRGNIREAKKRQATEGKDQDNPGMGRAGVE